MDLKLDGRDLWSVLLIKLHDAQDKTRSGFHEICSKAHMKRDESSRELKALSVISATKFQILDLSQRANKTKRVIIFQALVLMNHKGKGENICSVIILSLNDSFRSVMMLPSQWKYLIRKSFTFTGHTNFSYMLQ